MSYKTKPENNSFIYKDTFFIRNLSDFKKIKFLPNKPILVEITSDFNFSDKNYRISNLSELKKKCNLFIKKYEEVLKNNPLSLNKNPEIYKLTFEILIETYKNYPGITNYFKSKDNTLEEVKEILNIISNDNILIETDLFPIDLSKRTAPLIINGKNHTLKNILINTDEDAAIFSNPSCDIQIYNLNFKNSMIIGGENSSLIVSKPAKSQKLIINEENYKEFITDAVCPQPKFSDARIYYKDKRGVSVNLPNHNYTLTIKPNFFESQNILMETAEIIKISESDITLRVTDDYIGSLELFNVSAQYTDIYKKTAREYSHAEVSDIALGNFSNLYFSESCDFSSVIVSDPEKCLYSKNNKQRTLK